MKHVTYSQKSLFLGDEAADLLIEYARLVAKSQTSDTVTVPAVGSDGNQVRATFLLTTSTIIMVESTDSDFAGPLDEGTVEDLRQRIDRISAVNVAQPESNGPIGIEDDLR